MCVDHAGLALFPSVGAFRCIGRPAFPLYCFLLVQGFRHTRDLRAYARRLLLLACVSEIPFDLLIFGQFSSAMEQNVVFALLLGLMALYAAKALAARLADPEGEDEGCPFCPLSEGVIDFKELKRALEAVNFDGIGVVEQDMAHAKPEESFELSKKNREYLHEIGMI